MESQVPGEVLLEDAQILVRPQVANPGRAAKPRSARDTATVSAFFTGTTALSE